MVPFHFWRSLIERAGYKLSDIPKTWDAFLDFFMPVQRKLRASGVRDLYAYGYPRTAIEGNPDNVFAAMAARVSPLLMERFYGQPSDTGSRREGARQAHEPL